MAHPPEPSQSRKPSIWSYLKYKLWLLSGGQRTESGFRFLSQEIIQLTKERNEMRAQLRDLERRVWDLEGHSPTEHIEKAAAAIRKVSEAALRRDASEDWNY